MKNIKIVNHCHPCVSGVPQKSSLPQKLGSASQFPTSTFSCFYGFKFDTTECQTHATLVFLKKYFYRCIKFYINSMSFNFLKQS